MPVCESLKWKAPAKALVLRAATSPDPTKFQRPPLPRWPGEIEAELSGGLAARLLRYFKAQVEDWYDVCRSLSDWEDRHLAENPTPERLTEHARLLNELERVGRWLLLAAQSPDFPDRGTAELIAMTLQDLKDRRSLWHGQMSEGRRAEILQAIFHES